MLDGELTALHATLRGCRLCAEAGHAIVPGAVFSGTPGARVMTIGQAPGVTEVTARRPFNAGSGRRLFQWLAAAGWEEGDFRARQYMTSVTKCYPGKHPNGKGDRVPSRAEQALCQPYLRRELALVRPQLIIPIGGLAIKLFFATRLTLHELIGTAVWLPTGTWETGDPFDLAAGQPVHSLPHVDRGGRYIVPLPHPSGASLWHNRPENRARIDLAIGLLVHLREQLIGD